jgi:tight adherence protein B
MSKTWESAASELRSEQALFGQVLAKQGWVLGSAKISLIAPWLIAVVLIQLEQNRNAFASELGALVLILGLLLSALAYFLVNRLAKLTLPRRIFYATS